MGGLSPLDPSSYSRPEEALVTNIELSLNVNFEEKIFSGFVILTVEKIKEHAEEVILDSKDLTILSIKEVTLEDDIKYTISEPVKEFGSKITISLPTKDGTTYSFKIEYNTSPNASGLQWLAVEQTAGKKHPYVFSHFEAIHARSFLPCQDTPGVKCKYMAVVAAPPPHVVVMSAIRDRSGKKKDINLYHFVQDVPIPSYLIAIAVGALESREIGPRSLVWAEKEIIEQCAYEFATTEQQLQAAESICGPYVWGIYDLLVLPPSFPYGGMENPCLTFVTPTLLAGDRSMVDVIAHEIAHSWTGNLITNRNFEHFWLNEGFTVFIERKILGRLQSSKDQDFNALQGIAELKNTIEHLGEENPLTKLVVDLKDLHPDDSFSTVPYEKGQTFLRYLEEVVGGPSTFEPFLKKYFTTFKYKSVDTSDFKSFFLKEFSSVDKVKDIDWDLWLYGTGLPPYIPNYDKSIGEASIRLFELFSSYKEATKTALPQEDFKNLSSKQKVYFLQLVVDSAEIFTVAKLKELEKILAIDETKNSEIKFRWFRVCIKSKWEQKLPMILSWLNEVGRMKFVRPLYRDLYNWKFAKNKTVNNFKANRKYMMHVVSYMLELDLNLRQ